MKELFGKLRNFFRSPSYPRTITLIGLLIIIIALPVTVVVLQQQTQTKQGAYVDCSGTWTQCGGDSGYCGGSLIHHKVQVTQPARCSSPVACVDLGVSVACGFVPTCPTGVPNGSFCTAGGICRAEGGYYINGSCGAGQVCCSPQPTTAPTATPTPRPSGNNAACTQFVDSHPYDYTKGSGGCLTAKDCQLNGPDNSTVAQTDACTTGSGVGSNTVCCAQLSKPTNCATGTFAPPDTGTCIDLNTQTCNETGTARTTTDCGGSGNPGLKYCCKTGKVGTRTITCAHPNQAAPNNSYTDSATNSTKYCAADEVCTTTIKNGSPCAKAAGTEAACVNFDHVPLWFNCNDFAKQVVPDCPYPGNYVDVGVTNWFDPAFVPILPVGPTKSCVYKPGATKPTPFDCGLNNKNNAYCWNGYSCPTSTSSHNDQYSGGDYTGCGTYALCCVRGNSSTPIPPPPTRSSEQQCTDANGICYFNLSGCPDGRESAGQKDCNGITFCCVPKSGGGGGGGGGNQCTNGKRTQFAVNIKLPGIGGGTFENHTPANPIKHGSLVVKDGNGTVKNGQEHDFSHSFGHENGNGKAKSEHVDLGSSTLVCGQTYHVEIKIPGYITMKKDVTYGQDQTLDIAESDVIAGDIVSDGTTNTVVNGKVIGDDKITIADYNIFKACHENPTQIFSFTSNTQTLNLKCSDLINLFDFQDGGAGVDANGISEFADNYNLWLRGYIKANGF